VTFYLQSWCISVRGPLYSAMFNPLCTVITTVFAAIVLREELHVGRSDTGPYPGTCGPCDRTGPPNSKGPQNIRYTSDIVM